jgi:hypothetical protein
MFQRDNNYRKLKRWNGKSKYAVGKDSNIYTMTFSIDKQFVDSRTRKIQEYYNLNTFKLHTVMG